jgi:hypothetical protein
MAKISTTKHHGAAIIGDEPPFTERLKHYETILGLGSRAEVLQKEYEQAKEDAKSAREAWEEAVFELQAAIRRANDPQKEFTFDE